MGYRILVPLLVVIGSAPAVLAQDDEYLHHHNFSAGIGPAVPQGSSGQYLGTAPLVAVRYGYRFNRYLQADAGFQLAFGAANNQNPLQTDVGVVQGGDREYMLPLGGRVILPTPYRRMEFAVGGGTAYLHYSETAPSSAYYQLTCYSCTSRGGWGGYGLVNASYFLDSNHNFRIGTTVQYISARTTGQAVGNVVANTTSDHWLNWTFDFGLSF